MKLFWILPFFVLSFALSSALAQSDSFDQKKEQSSLRQAVELFHQMPTEFSYQVKCAMELDFSGGKIASINHAIDYFHGAEQICAFGISNQQELERVMLEKFEDIIKSFRDDFEYFGFTDFESLDYNQQGQITNDFRTEAWSENKDFPSKASWLNTLEETENSLKRCELLKIAYLYSLWEVSTLAPSSPHHQVRDLFVYPDADQTTLEKLNRDQGRASYAFRFLTSVPPSLYPIDCQGPYGRSLYQEVQLRHDFIFGELPIRKPLGFAVGMCGRSMNAHYIDDFVTSGEQQSPYGWSEESIHLIDD